VPFIDLNFVIRNAHLERDPFQPNPVLVLNGSNEYVEFNNHTNSGCINDLIGCQTGFTWTAKLKVGVVKMLWLIAIKLKL
jgi:hypothetical protein